MSNIRSLGDYGKKDDDPNRKKTSSFAGGEKSGLAVENPLNDEFANVERLSGPPPPGSRKVTLYKNGFTVDDGTLRLNDTPENSRFLKELQAGIAPREFLVEGSGAPVHVSLDDRRADECKVPAVAKLFTGDGVTMGNERTSSAAGEVDISVEGVVVDESKPVTSLQLRFHNGQRRTLRMNEDHTLNDVHFFLMRAAPVNGDYKLVEGFPPREITIDSSTTIKDAGLLQATITQKLC